MINVKKFDKNLEELNKAQKVLFDYLKINFPHYKNELSLEKIRILDKLQSNNYLISVTDKWQDKYDFILSVNYYGKGYEKYLNKYRKNKKFILYEISEEGGLFYKFTDKIGNYKILIKFNDPLFINISIGEEIVFKMNNDIDYSKINKSIITGMVNTIINHQNNYIVKNIPKFFEEYLLFHSGDVEYYRPKTHKIK